MRKIILFLLLLPFTVFAQEVNYPAVDGWARSGKTLFFNSENLYEHIDGASEFYLSYGFQSLQVARWEKSGSELTIEVYDHGTPVNAYGIYSMERPESAQTKAIGLEGYYDNTVLNFVTGKYYVKMNSYHVENAGAALLERIALKLGVTLCASPQYPKVVAIFPKENLIANSVQCISSEFMGLGFLGAATRSKYQFPAGAETVFIIEKGNGDEAGAVVKKYFEFTEEKMEKLEEGDFAVNDPFNGKVLLRWSGKYLIGATPGNDKLEVAKLFDQIVDALNK
jgi:hypothetical protein